MTEGCQVLDGKQFSQKKILGPCSGKKDGRILRDSGET